jgi:hypothetical protein
MEQQDPQDLQELQVPEEQQASLALQEIEGLQVPQD